MSNIEIIKSDVVHEQIYFSTKFQCFAFMKKFYFNVNLNNAQNIDLSIIIDKILEVFEKLKDDVVKQRKLSGNDQIRIAFRNESLNNEVYVPFIELQNFHPSLLSNELEKVMQSKKEFLMNESFEMDIMAVNLPSVAGHKKRRSTDVDNWCTRSTKSVKISDDNLCLLRAFIVGKAHAEHKSGKLEYKEFRRIREDTSKIQTKAANELFSNLNLIEGLPINPHHVLPKIQELYKNKYQIICFTPPFKILFKGESTGKQIYILIQNEHADSVLSMSAYLSTSYFCTMCLQGHDNFKTHKCNEICKYCETFPSCVLKEKIQCNNCKLFFVSDVCLKNHEAICGKKKYCENCKKIYLNGKHFCDKKYCLRCNIYVDNIGHYCYQRPLNKNLLIQQDNYPKVFMFYDFECMVETEKNGFQYHRPNVCITQVVCSNCWNSEDANKINSYCPFCKGEQKIFSGVDTVENFMEYLFTEYENHLKEKQYSMKLKKPIPIIAIAHNSRSYDAIFIIKYCLSISLKKPDIIKKGSKILQMTINNIKFIDSLSFIPMSLKKFSKTFGLGLDGDKSEFPHGFNTPDNWNYKGNIPDLKFYYPENRTNEEREDLIKWHQSQKYAYFDFQKEIVKYCAQDVLILMRSVMIYRDNWIKATGLDCFTRSITLPMATMETFKANYLKPNQIAIIPLEGYQPLRKASYLGQTWLDFIEKQRGVEIKREYKLRNYYADGFIERTKEVFEFNGCYFHGCKSCYPVKRKFVMNKVINRDMEYLYARTMEKEEYYKKEGMTLTSLWQCQLNASLRSSKEMKTFFSENLRRLKNRKFFPPIEPRRALFGGRVNCSKLYHEVDSDEKLLYFDFTSLYPFCNKRKHYPLGHPEIIRNPGKTDISNYEGLIFCKVLPPQNLYYAVLPMHINDQILYTLCYKCAYDKNKSECNHSEEERMLISTWVSVELNLAINKGYRIIDIYEVWHFDTISGGERNDYQWSVYKLHKRLYKS